MNNYLALGLGIACAGLGGEFFIRGTIGLARWLRVSAGIIGVTVTAFATSSPELSVAISSAMAGTPQIALGDALGSNIVNVALILGIALVFSKIGSRRKDIMSNYRTAILSPIIIGILAIDGILTRIDGMILITVFVVWITRMTIIARHQRKNADEVMREHHEWLAIIFGVIGLVLLIAAGRLIVSGASGIAEAMGIGSFTIGAVIVAFGTSVPELATVAVSKLKKHDEIGLNTILGSNIFNGLLIIGVAATIYPISLVVREVMIVLAFGIVTVSMTLPSKNGYLERWRGIVLLALYFAFVFTNIH